MQFILSVMSIVAVIIVYQQLQFVQNKNLGYQPDQVIFFAREGELEKNYPAFLSELKKLPGVVNASYIKGDLAGGINNRSGVHWPGQRPEQVQTPFHYLADGFDLSTSAIVFNEAAIEQMGLREPIGQIVDFDGKRQIVGVVKNFHFQSLHEKVKPFFFKIHYTWQGGDFIVILNASTQQATLRQVAKLYAQYNPGYPFDFRFMDADSQSLYLSEQRVAQLSQ